MPFIIPPPRDRRDASHSDSDSDDDGPPPLEPAASPASMQAASTGIRARDERGVQTEVTNDEVLRWLRRLFADTAQNEPVSACDLQSGSTAHPLTDDDGGYLEGHQRHERCAWDAPVLATDVVMISVDASVDQNSNKDENYDGDDFERRQPVLCESVGAMK